MQDDASICANFSWSVRWGLPERLLAGTVDEDADPDFEEMVPGLNLRLRAAVCCGKPDVILDR